MSVSVPRRLSDSKDARPILTKSMQPLVVVQTGHSIVSRSILFSISACKGQTSNKRRLMTIYTCSSRSRTKSANAPLPVIINIRGVIERVDIVHTVGIDVELGQR